MKEAGPFTNMIKVNNPFDGQLVSEVPEFTSQNAAGAIERAIRGRSLAAVLTSRQRSEILNNTAELVALRGKEFAECITREAGKPISSAKREVMRCINTLQLSAAEAIQFNGETIPFDSMESGAGKLGFYENKPLGVILAITPYNDPLNLVAHKLGPAVATGNSVILKPSEMTPLSAIMLCDAFLEAGLPEECISVVTGYGAKLGDSLFRHDAIRMISFTGGVESGKKIAKMSGMVKLSLELGGVGSSIVMADADLIKAISACVDGAFSAAGQNCISVQNVFIERSVYESFCKEFVLQTATLVSGDPQFPETDIGPMITEQAAVAVEQKVDQLIAEGATLLHGHKRSGSVYEPTVLASASSECWADKNEIFGPVVILHAIDTLDEAVDRCNRTPGTIHQSIFTSNLQSAMKAYRCLDASMVLVNDSTDFRIDGMPFGGVGSGGIGREGVKFSMAEMTQTKALCLS
ncbi:aldehyde dehydrogenase family protein [Amphritea sp. 2_MG-2023]|uniref:aldehyde dehydrogenase family protein n=1 Tax=Amphritea TaxID=515417 RepID=UPI001C074AF2|nr:MULTISPECIES: aldehyde dehydrogenase family protein [Amphritea]MBU2966745.1 aldehyde dehydrogenase family protein [Amphritea atlantica]MDO6418990.1 aldehyde dehydrogenase family protein [Amphritea sp. 2_MG-2023]